MGNRIYPTKHAGSATHRAAEDPLGPGATVELSPLAWYHTAYHQAREDPDLDLNHGSQ